MALTKEDLQAIGTLMDGKLSGALEPINNRLDKMDARFDKVDARLDTLEGKVEVVRQYQLKVDARLDTLEERVEVVRQSQLNVELTELPRIAAALDGYSIARDKNKQQDERITYLERKADNHDMRLGALEMAGNKA